MLPVLVLLLAGCGPEEASRTPASSPRPAETRETPQVQARADWLNERVLPAPKSEGFEGRYVYAPPRRAVPLSKLEEAQQQAQASPVVAPPPPYKYVGKVTRGRDQGHAVLARDDKVFLVREGDAVDGGYRVHSVSDTQLVLIEVASGTEHALAYTTGVVPNAIMPPMTGLEDQPES